MAVKRKPKSQKKENAVNDKIVDDILSKGGSSISKNRAANEDDAEDKVLYYQVRLFKSKMNEIDAIRSKLPKHDRARRSRHEWVMRAIDEMLEKEKERLAK